MDCVIRSADQTVYQGAADRVVARSPHGEFAVMKGHAPLLAVLVAGAVKVQSEGQEFIFLCKQGTFSTDGDHVTILVERPMKLDEIDVPAIRDRLAAQEDMPLTERMDAEESTYLKMLCQVKESHG